MDKIDKMDKIVHGLDLSHEIADRNMEILKKELGIKDEDIKPLDDTEE